MSLMLPHQGEHIWEAVFYPDEEDARVYITSYDVDDDYWVLSAPSTTFFFWDLAQTGLTWYQSTKYKGGKNVRKTDLGLIPDNT